jgi:DNA-binding transcriptional LysR family regulator
MDLWQLHIYAKVVEHRSFSKAGSAVHLSQPTVSSHIKYLEDYFQCRLVDRLSREVLPTRAGELLYHYAQRLLALKSETENAMAEFLGCIKGPLVIGGSTIPGGYVLPSIVGGFKKVFPAVQLRLRIGDSAEIIQAIIDGDLEVGVVGARASDQCLQQTKIMDDVLRLVVPTQHSWARRSHVDLEELRNLPLIIREAGSGTMKTIQRAIFAKGLTWSFFNIVAEMGSTEAIRQGIKSGIGLSILSVLAIEDELRTGTLSALTLDGLDLERSFYLTHQRNRTLSPMCQAFMAYLTAHCPRIPVDPDLEPC